MTRAMEWDARGTAEGAACTFDCMNEYTHLQT